MNKWSMVGKEKEKNGHEERRKRENARLEREKE
jgi:hypothetical protein